MTGAIRPLLLSAITKHNGRLILTGKLIQKSRIKCTCTTIKF